MAPLEPWEKVLVDADTYPDSEHGQIPCETCHGGVQSADMEAAHEGVVARPSSDPGEVCAQCHEKQAANFENSLHASLGGYWTAIDTRSVPENHAALEEMFGNHCSSCHTTCGDCHVSQPASVGGGLIEGHLFNAKPSMTRNCTACHGSRVGNEYLGKNEGFMPDVHFREARMLCVDCHEGSTMHGVYGESGTPANRYAGSQSPACVNCHPKVETGSDGVPHHALHSDRVACQVCHSVSYTSCDGCHVAISETSGKPFFATEASYLSFMIGRNPLKNDERPYEYVPLRHIPVAPTSYAFYGDNLLPNFDALPTWAYATPHNIQRNTPQTETCDACHGNAEIFLTVDKVKPEELEANQPVIVETVPVLNP